MADQDAEPSPQRDPQSAEPDAEELRVNRAKYGDETVWQQWYDECYSSLFKYAYFRLRRRSEAEDIVSQVFLEAIKGIDRYRYRGTPIIAWLYRIARNLIADRIKKENRELSIDSPAHAEGDPEDLLETIDLLNALEKLSGPQRDVVILRYFMALPTRDVAAVLSKSEAAVYSLHARALLELRKHLAGKEEL